MGIPLNLDELRPEVAQEFLECRHNRLIHSLLNAEAEQQEVGAAAQGEHRAIEGLGRARLNIGSTAFHYWGQRFGTYACWNDEGFVREYERDNPAARIKCGGTKTQVGYTGRREVTRYGGG